MSFLTEQHESIRRLAREFTEQEIVPIADALDQEAEVIPEPVLTRMAEPGFFGINLPREWGGAGLDTVSLCIVTEELSRGWLGVGSVIARNILCGHALLHGGTPSQKEKFLPRMAAGEWQSATAGTEPEAGSDAANIQTKAHRDGDHYVINGTKIFCTFADRANVIFAYVRTSDESKHRGISLVLVEKQPGLDFQPPTLTATRIPTVGYHGMRTWALYFQDHRVPVENLVGGEEGQGFRQLMRGYEIARIQFAFRSIGLAQAAYEAALRYAKQRVQFGQPISKFQAVRFKLADMATDIEAARQLGYHAARKFDSGERCDLEAGMAKLFAAEMALRHAWNALEIHGGIGYTLQSPAQRYWRDAGLLPIGEGTSEIQREVIARRILEER